MDTTTKSGLIVPKESIPDTPQDQDTPIPDAEQAEKDELARIEALPIKEVLRGYQRGPQIVYEYPPLEDESAPYVYRGLKKLEIKIVDQNTKQVMQTIQQEVEFNIPAKNPAEAFAMFHESFKADDAKRQVDAKKQNAATIENNMLSAVQDQANQTASRVMDQVNSQNEPVRGPRVEAQPNRAQRRHQGKKR